MWPGVLWFCDLFIVIFDADVVSSNRDHSRSRSDTKSRPIKAVDADDVYVVFFACGLRFDRFSCSCLICSVDISSEDDTRSIKSTKSVKRYIFYLLITYCLSCSCGKQCNVGRR